MINLMNFKENKNMQLINLKERSSSRSLNIGRTIEKARQIEEERKQKIINKEIERDERLKEHLQDTNSIKQNQSVQKDYYRQAVKLASHKIEEEKRNTYLKMLESKEDRFRQSKSRRDDEYKTKLDFTSMSKSQRQDYIKNFQEKKEKEKEEKLRRLILKDEYLDEIKKNREEDNRLRSVIHVQNKFILNNGKDSALRNPKLANSSSYIIGASNRVYDSSSFTSNNINLMTVEAKPVHKKNRDSEIE